MAKIVHQNLIDSLAGVLDKYDDYLATIGCSDERREKSRSGVPAMQKLAEVQNITADKKNQIRGALETVVDALEAAYYDARREDNNRSINHHSLRGESAASFAVRKIFGPANARKGGARAAPAQGDPFFSATSDSISMMWESLVESINHVDEDLGKGLLPRERLSIEGKGYADEPGKDYFDPDKIAEESNLIFGRCKAALSRLIEEYGAGNGNITDNEALARYAAIRTTALSAGAVQYIAADMKKVGSSADNVKARVGEFVGFLHGNSEFVRSHAEKTYFCDAIAAANQRFNDEILIMARPIPASWRNWYSPRNTALPPQVRLRGGLSRREFFEASGSIAITGALAATGAMTFSSGVYQLITGDMRVDSEPHREVAEGALTTAVYGMLFDMAMKSKRKQEDATPPSLDERHTLLMGARLEELLEERRHEKSSKHR